MAVDPIDMIYPDADVVRILRPKGVFRMLLGLLHLRNDRLRACWQRDQAGDGSGSGLASRG
jgi:hypothetical protein